MRPTPRPLILAAALFAAAAGVAPAQPAPPSPPPANAQDAVGTLIARLSDDDYATRERATLELVRLGDAAVPRLRELLPLTVDGETRNRIQSAIDQIVEQAVTGQSLITLNVTDADPKAVFAELSRQARADLVIAPDVLASLPKITFRCDAEPFWPALRRLCSPLGLQPDTLTVVGGLPIPRRAMAQSPSRTLNLIRSSSAWDRTPTTFAGPFMICVQQITQTGVVIPAVGQRAHNLVVQCIVLAEPKMTIVGRSATARVTEPDPDANPPVNLGGVNNPLLAQRPPFSRGSYLNLTPASAWSVLIPLPRPAGATDVLPRLRATATAKVLVRSETWELPDIARAAPRFWTAGNRTFTVKSVTRKDDNIELVCTATRRPDRPAAGIDPEDQAVFNYLDLLDPAGRALNVRARAPRGTDATGTTSYTIHFEATAEGAPIQPPSTPLRLRWRLPLESKDIDLPIDFSDLPLP